jgi:hypothetical protein
MGSFRPSLITPASVNELIVLIIGSQGSFSPAFVNDYFTLLGQEPSAGADAYPIDSSDPSINKTWTLTDYTFAYTEVAIAAFDGGSRHRADPLLRSLSVNRSRGSA